MQVDNEDFGRPVADYFGVSGDGPIVRHSCTFYPLNFIFGWKMWVGGGEIGCLHYLQ